MLSLVALPAGRSATITAEIEILPSVATLQPAQPVPPALAKPRPVPGSGAGVISPAMTEPAPIPTMRPAPIRTALWNEPGGSSGTAKAPGKARQDLARPARPLASPDYGVFRSVAVPIGGLKVQQTWRRLIPGEAEIANLRDCSGAKATRCRPGLREMAKTAGLDMAAPLTRETLGKVNRGVNRFIAYAADSRIHGRPDHWASIDEILALRRGDCEDYAIAKMWMLAAFGMPLEHMQFVVLHDTRRRLYHAVLVVHHDGERLVLDNTTDHMVSQELIGDYLPLYSLAAGNAYVHGFSASGTARVSKLAPIGEVFPGLGAETEPQGAPGGDLGTTGITGILL